MEGFIWKNIGILLGYYHDMIKNIHVVDINIYIYIFISIFISIYNPIKITLRRRSY